MKIKNNRWLEFIQRDRDTDYKIVISAISGLVCFGSLPFCSYQSSGNFFKIGHFSGFSLLLFVSFQVNMVYPKRAARLFLFKIKMFMYGSYYDIICKIMFNY